MSRVISVQVHEVRFPTSLSADGSDAMNQNADYSAAYVTLVTDEPVGRGVLRGHGFAFTIGRGNELCVSAAKIYSDRLIGFDFQQIIDDRRKSDVGRARSNRLGLLGEFDLHWIEEHTSPDDINGGATHLRVRPKSA